MQSKASWCMGDSRNLFFTIPKTDKKMEQGVPLKAVQVVLENDIDLVSKDDIRICSAHIFLPELV